MSYKEEFTRNRTKLIIQTVVLLSCLGLGIIQETDIKRATMSHEVTMQINYLAQDSVTEL